MTLSTSAEKSKFLNKYQIFLKEFDENSRKYQTIRWSRSLKTFTAVRHRDTAFKRPTFVWLSVGVTILWRHLCATGNCVTQPLPNMFFYNDSAHALFFFFPKSFLKWSTRRMTISYLLAHTSNSLYKFTSVNFFFIHGESHFGVGKSTTCKHLAQVSQINWSFTYLVDWPGQCSCTAGSARQFPPARERGRVHVGPVWSEKLGAEVARNDLRVLLGGCCRYFLAFLWLRYQKEKAN